MKIVITGASGFIGTHLLKLLPQGDGRVVAVSRRPISVTETHIKIKTIRVDDYSKTPSGDVLVHLAENAEVGEANRACDPEQYINQNLYHLEKIVKKKFQKIIYISSGVVYGDQSNFPRTEDENLIPPSVYGRSKKRCEDFILHNAGGYVLRLANVYGPGMSPNNVISDIFSSLKSNSEELTIRDESPVRDFIFVTDVARGIYDVINSNSIPGIYNLSTGIGTSIGELASTILTICNLHTSKKITSTTATTVTTVTTVTKNKKSCLILDPSKAEKMLHWKANINLKTGLNYFSF